MAALVGIEASAGLCSPRRHIKPVVMCHRCERPGRARKGILAARHDQGDGNARSRLMLGASGWEEVRAPAA
jgi:hypothetical protein